MPRRDTWSPAKFYNAEADARLILGPLGLDTTIFSGARAPHAACDYFSAAECALTRLDGIVYMMLHELQFWQLKKMSGL